MSSIIALSVDSYIAHIQLSNSIANNKISLAFLQEFKRILNSISQDKSVKAVLISANGKYFSDGFDFQELKSVHHRSISQHKRLIQLYQKLLYCMFNFKKPIVTIVNGLVRAGGVGIVATSDYVIATENAKFEMAELLFGLIPAAVMSYLSRRISIQILKQIILTTELLDSKKALQYGIVDTTIEHEKILTVVKSTCKHLLRLNSHGVQILKSFSKQIGDGQKISKLTKKSGHILGSLLFYPGTLNNIHLFTEYGVPPVWFTKYNPNSTLLQKIYG